MLKALGRSPAAVTGLSYIAAAYFRFVRATTRFVAGYEGLTPDNAPDMPVIFAMWHGQHFMASSGWQPGMDVSVLISRSDDGELGARIVERLGVRVIRGSGGHGRKINTRGGAMALREMLRTLRDGSSVALTADVPKVSRISGLGIIALSQMSGRPIHPVAVVNARRIDFNNWDHSSVGLPFGRGAVVIGEPIYVAKDATPDQMEQARVHVQNALDEVHTRAYALVGSYDPGARDPDARDSGAREAA